MQLSRLTAQTHCVDAQMAEGACAATALLSGAKTNRNTIGIAASVDASNFAEAADPANHLDGIVTWAQVLEQSQHSIPFASGSGLYWIRRISILKANLKHVFIFVFVFVFVQAKAQYELISTIHKLFVFKSNCIQNFAKS
jgi:Alkaline phosphatase